MVIIIFFIFFIEIFEIIFSESVDTKTIHSLSSISSIFDITYDNFLSDFDAVFKEENVLFDNDLFMLIKIDNKSCPNECYGYPLSSGSIYSTKKFGYGYYGLEMKQDYPLGVKITMGVYSHGMDDYIYYEFVRNVNDGEPYYYSYGYTIKNREEGGCYSNGFMDYKQIDVTKEYIEVGLLWNEEFIEFYIDGKMYNQTFDHFDEKSCIPPINPMTVEIFVGAEIGNGDGGEWIGEIPQHKLPIFVSFKRFRFIEGATKYPGQVNLDKPKAGVYIGVTLMIIFFIIIIVVIVVVIIFMKKRSDKKRLKEKMGYSFEQMDDLEKEYNSKVNFADFKIDKKYV